MIGELSGSFYKNAKAEDKKPFGVRFGLYPGDTSKISTLPLSTALKEMIVKYASENKLVKVEIDECYLPCIAAMTLPTSQKILRKGRKGLMILTEITVSILFKEEAVKSSTI